MKLFYFGFCLNVILSLFCAYELLFFTETLNAMIPIGPLLLKLLAFGLLLFSSVLIYNIIKPSLNLSVIISLMDSGWIIVTTLAAIIFINRLGDDGFVLIVEVNGVITLAMIAQYYSTFALLKHPDINSNFQYRLCINRKVHASKADFWRVLSALSDIHKYSSGINSSVVEGDYGVSSKRTCSTSKDQEGKVWTEEVYEWNEGVSFSVKFNADVKEFPFPFRELSGGWKLGDFGENTTVSVWFEFNTKPSKLIVPVFLLLWSVSLPKVIKNLDHAARND